jgi:hypothetical protein
MRFPIEFNNEPVTVHALGSGKIVLRAPHSDGIIKTVPPSAAVEVCAWCVPSSEQQPLRDAGFKLTHGICRHCEDRQKRKGEAYYEQAQ